MHLPSLVYIGDSLLLSRCDPLDLDAAGKHLASLQDRLEMLRECQRVYGGIGIAAPQVGWRTRIFSMGFMDEDENSKARQRYPNAKHFSHQFWINPEVTPVADSGTCWFWEGCLSVPGMRGWVERPRAIHIRGWNERGERVEAQYLDGLPARVAQHELDHLDGILFPTLAVPGTLLPVQSFEDGRQNQWPESWPTPGSRKTAPGDFAFEL